VLAPCIFEYVYFARPDSVIDGASVYGTRLKMGEYLAEAHCQRTAPGRHRRRDAHSRHIAPVGDATGDEAESRLSRGFLKNRYVGRTFIMPGQAVRKKSVRQKLNAMSVEFKGKNVLLVDDSIVRGTTSHEIVQMARDSGANKVYFASASPPVRYPNVYGIDMPTPGELIANGRSDDEIRDAIGADALVYQNIESMKKAIGSLGQGLDGFDASCFDGVYVTGDITSDDILRLNENRVGAEEGEEDTSRLALPNQS
jgi:amidophosphoribosyltransferase